MRPCYACPFRLGVAYGMTPAKARLHAEAVLGGSWACCHIKMGDCHGSQRFAENVAKGPGTNPEVVGSVDEFVEQISRHSGARID